MTPLLTNWALKSLMFMAAIGIAALLVGVRELILRGVPRAESNAGDE